MERNCIQKWYVRIDLKVSKFVCYSDENAKNTEIIKLIKDCYIKTIETTPVLHSIEDLSTAYIFDKNINSALEDLLSM